MLDNFRHPYGVKPIGNSLLATDEERATRGNGFGSLRILTDETILEILGFLDAFDLSSMSMTSKACYVYSMTYDLWRDLCLRFVNKSIQFQSTWRDTYVSEYLKRKHQSDSADLAKKYIHTPICATGVFSDYLHRLWTSHAFDLTTHCPHFLDYDNVDRLPVSDDLTDRFVREYEGKNVPVVIKQGAADWPAMTKWDEAYLEATCGERSFRATSATAPEACSFTLAQYFRYAAQTREEVPLYLFERDFVRLAPALARDYAPPGPFDPARRPDTDLFRVLGAGRRPDYQCKPTSCTRLLSTIAVSIIV